MGAGTELLELSQLDERHRALRIARPELMASLRSSMTRHGVLQPLIANREGASIVLLDGFKRLQLGRELGTSKLSVRLVSLSAAQAKAAMLAYNAPHRGLSEVEEALVVGSLVRGEHLQQVAVAQLVGKHKSWVCRRLALLERLEPSVLEDLRLGLVPIAVVRELVRLPRGNQVDVAAAIHSHGLTSRQSSVLVTHLQHASPEQWQALLEAPHRFLVKATKPTASGIEPDPRLGARANELREALLRVERSACALLGRLGRFPKQALRSDERLLLEVLASTATNSAEQVIERLGREFLDARRA